jgi:23S rRNA (pseudouridine1915-N3)-methyltransferase
MDSGAFAHWLQSLREQARDVAIIIGGAGGVTEDVRTGAEQLLALAPWTLPHEVARLVLAEQLYRAGTILKGEPYHK